ncbi:hypothetical protein [Motilimonas pumila]|uniref:KfrA N-terminal DNA-binding domain-containing protein n=1 Tax=Motilimonas pumila TaxID=2303987 RepID=A0A418YJN8_9GAMM|nr:hypothetical protein [Motilimonas pumila]RJG51197.1 hypothetical protein D1Z90_00185 [Motilimonas pumila]
MEDVIRIAQQLNKAGQKPTVALVKAKLSPGYPLPKIIAALKNWQSHPDLTEQAEENKASIDSDQTSATAAPAPISVDQLIKLQISQYIEQQVTPQITELQQQIADLKAQLAAKE